MCNACAVLDCNTKAWACLFCLRSGQIPLQKNKLSPRFSYYNAKHPKQQYMSIKDIENKSFAFIEQNFNATFAELPEDLFKIWHITIPIETYLEGDYQNQYEFRIFLYALRKYEEIHGIRIPEETIPALFKTFQLMLSIPSLRKNPPLRETAFRIFDFQLYLDLI